MNRQPLFAMGLFMKVAARDVVPNEDGRLVHTALTSLDVRPLMCTTLSHETQDTGGELHEDTV